jgi:hypothetical protein
MRAFQMTDGTMVRGGLLFLLLICNDKHYGKRQAEQGLAFDF